MDLKSKPNERPDRQAAGPKQVAALILLLLVGVQSCASSKENPGRLINVGIGRDKDLIVEDDFATVAIDVQDQAIVMTFGIGQRRLVMEGAKTFLGQIGTRKGWVRVGALRVAYDEKELNLQYKNRAFKSSRLENGGLYADQFGQVGPSIFR